MPAKTGSIVWLNLTCSSSMGPLIQSQRCDIIIVYLFRLRLIDCAYAIDSSEDFRLLVTSKQHWSSSFVFVCTSNDNNMQLFGGDYFYPSSSFDLVVWIHPLSWLITRAPSTRVCEKWNESNHFCSSPSHGFALFLLSQFFLIILHWIFGSLFFLAFCGVAFVIHLTRFF